MSLSSSLWRSFAILLVASSGWAATIYTYAGNNFDPAFATGDPGVNASNSITASFSVDSPLGPNRSDFAPVLNSWTMTDGVHTFGSANGDSLWLWSLWTDGGGNIVEWLMTTDLTVFPYIATENRNPIAFDSFALTEADSASVIGNPGVWTQEIAGVPEPGSMVLMLLGGLVLAAKLASSRR